MKCKQSNDVSILAQKYSPVFKKTAVNSERMTQESYIRLISWVPLYIERDEKYRNVLHQNDVWHRGENIALKINTVSIKAMYNAPNCVFILFQSSKGLELFLVKPIWLTPNLPSLLLYRQVKLCWGLASVI